MYFYYHPEMWIQLYQHTRSKWDNLVKSVEKSNLEMALALALQLIFSNFSRKGLGFSTAKNCLNEKQKYDLS